MSFRIDLEFEKATVLEDKYGTDTIYLNLTKDMARTIHPGRYFDIFKGAYLKLDVTTGRGREVLEDLGVPSSHTEFISM